MISAVARNRSRVAIPSTHDARKIRSSAASVPVVGRSAGPVCARRNPITGSANRPMAATVSSSGTVAPGVSLTMIARSDISRRNSASNAVRVWLMVPRYEPATRINGSRSAIITSRIVRCSSSGTMMPPTPSISKISWRCSTAERQNATTSSTSIRSPSRRAAASGDIGARNRQGEMRSMFGKVAGKPSAWRRSPGSLVADRSGSNPLTTGLIASTERPNCRKCRIKDAATKVFPTSVPVPVMKIAVIPQKAP